MNNDTQKVHLFEAAGLGTGPFKLDHVTSEGGNCQFCGTSIVFRFYIRGSDQRQFFVGSDCVMKSNDTGLRRVVELEVKKRQAELRKKNQEQKLARLKTYLLDPNVVAILQSKTHPYSWHAKNGKTYKDYCDYVAKFGGNTAKLKLEKDIRAMIQ